MRLKNKKIIIFWVVLMLVTTTSGVVADEEFAPIAEANGPFELIDPNTGEPYLFGFYVEFEGSEVIFDGSESYDPDGTIESYAWYFLGTEGPPWSVQFSLAGETPAMTWDEPYASVISLRVWDDDGLTGDDLTYVIILDVPIDIKPGSYPNSINPKSKGVIPVAILNENLFVPEWVTPDSVRFGPDEAAPVYWAYEDVDGDEDIDLILHFKTQEAGFTEGDTVGTLTADFVNYYGPNTIHAEDSVRIVPPKK
jgi:hypothetical protein